jgi:ankyrin repeat protein
MVLSKGGDPNAMTMPPPPAANAEPPAPAPAAGGGGQAPKKRALEAAEYLLPPPPSPTPPLLIAARAGSIDAMKALLAAGAKPDAKAQDGLTLALAAAGGGNLDALKFALTLDPDINALAQGGKSIMHMVLANRIAPPEETEAIVTYLADRGAVLNVRDEHNIAPGDYINRVGPEQVRVFYIQLLKDRGVKPSTAH